VTGTYTGFSALHDVYPQTPEIVLASASIGAKSGHAPGVDLVVAEDTSGVDGTYPTTASCYEQAYVTAYASGIPFVVINGQTIHVGALVDPGLLTTWNGANGSGGPSTVQSDVVGETGTPWSVVQGQAWWIMAFIAKDLGTPVSTLASEYGWSTATQNAVAADVSSLS